MKTLFDIGLVVLALLIGGATFYGVIQGVTVDQRWRPVRREDDPFFYWLMMAMGFAITAICIWNVIGDVT